MRCETNAYLFLCFFAPFYQDRLGTKIGKENSKKRVAFFSRREGLLRPALHRAVRVRLWCGNADQEKIFFLPNTF